MSRELKALRLRLQPRHGDGRVRTPPRGPRLPRDTRTVPADERLVALTQRETLLTDAYRLHKAGVPQLA